MMVESIEAAKGESRLHTRVSLLLGVLSLLASLGFSQRGAMFDPSGPIVAQVGPQQQTALSVLPDQAPAFGTPGFFPTGGRGAFGRAPAGVGGAGGTAPGAGPGVGGDTGGLPASTLADAINPPAGDVGGPAGDGGTGGGDGTGGGGGGGGLPGGPGGSLVGPDASAPSATAPVPEPATWMVMILGIGIIGAALRRRRPVTANRLPAAVSVA